MKRKLSPETSNSQEKSKSSKRIHMDSIETDKDSIKILYNSTFGHIDELDQLFNEEVMESDTLAAFMMLYKEFSRYTTNKDQSKTIFPPFPILFRHQLYLTIQSRSEVDNEIDRLCDQQLIRIFIFQRETDCYLCVKNTDYLKHMKTIYKNIPKEYQIYFLNYINTQKKYTYYSRSKLCTDLNIPFIQQDRFFQLLTTYSCISSFITRSGTIFYNTIPNLTSFYSAISLGRKEILAILKRSKTIMTKNNLLTKESKNLTYGIIYHFRDMLGMNRILIKKTPNNVEFIQIP